MFFTEMCPLGGTRYVSFALFLSILRGPAKKPLTRVCKRVPGAHGKRGLGRGWQKRLAKGWRKVGEGLAKGCEGLAKGWRRVGGFPCTVQFRNSRGARLETLVHAISRPPTEVPNARHWKQPKNSRKRGAEWVTVKQPKTAETAEKQRKSSQNSCFSGVSAVFRLFYRDPLGTLFGSFSAVFNVGHLAPL